MRRANEALVKERHQISKLEKILSELNMLNIFQI